MAKIIGGLAIVLLLAGGVLVWQSNRATAPVQPEGQPAMSSEQGSDQSETVLEKGQQAIRSIRDAMSMNAPMKCVYDSGDGDKSISTEVHVAGEKFVTRTKTGEVITYALFDGQTQYIWTNNSQQGTKIDRVCLERFKNEGTDTSLRDYSADFNMASNVRCEPVEFDPPIPDQVPKEIVFTDQCAMLEESMKMMEQMKEKLPAGMTMPTMPGVAY